MAVSHKLYLIGLTAALALGSTQTAHGQVYVRTPSGGVVAVMPRAAVRPAVVPRWYNTYWPIGYYPYGIGSYGYYRTAAYLNGVASIYNAQAQYQVARSQAALLDQQATQSKIETQRKAFDEMMYRRAMAPTQEDLREKQQSNDLRRARNTPSDRDIWSGDAMNTLMAAIVRSEAELGFRGPQILLDQDNVKRLNVTTGTTSGSVSLVSQDKPLAWPQSLQKDIFDLPRETIDANLSQAVEVVRQSGTKNPSLTKVRDNLKALHVLLDKQIDTLSADEYIAGNRFLNQLSNAVDILEKPGAENYLNGKWAASGSTVDRLIYNLSQKGLRFAPAAPGDEAVYTAVYQAIRQYDAGLNKVASNR